MRKQYDIIIGIDPDCDRSGVAVLDMRAREMQMHSMTFPELVQYLTCVAADGVEGMRILVVVEASWRTETNWHGRRGDGYRVAAKKGYSVGRNHETGRKISEMAQAYGLEVDERRAERSYRLRNHCRRD